MHQSGLVLNADQSCCQMRKHFVLLYVELQQKYACIVAAQSCCVVVLKYILPALGPVRDILDEKVH